MALNDIVNVSITAGTSTVSRAGFGTPLIAGHHSNFPERVRSFKSIAELTAAGFGVNDPITRCATKILAQNPRPTTFKVGRRALATTQIIDLTPTITTEGTVVSVRVTADDGTVTNVTHTNGASETVATIVAALQTQLNAITNLTAVDTGPGTLVKCTATSPRLFDYSLLTGGLNVQDVSVDPGVATDLTAIEAEDADWYGLILDSNSEAEILAASTWASTRRVLFGANSADSGVLDVGVTTDVASDLETAGSARTFLIYSGSVLSYAAAAWLGKQLPTDPGSSTWAFKTLTSVATDNLSTTQETTLTSKTANYYVTVAGLNITQNGFAASGQFIDITRYIDFLAQRIRENVLSLLASNPKIPYTNAGIDQVRAEILAQLRRGIDTGAISALPEPVVSAPDVGDISAATRATRALPDITFTATLTGAIHSVVISGTLSV